LGPIVGERETAFKRSGKTSRGKNPPKLEGEKIIAVSTGAFKTKKRNV